MSGIVGVWNLDGAPVDRGLLEQMALAQAHRGSDGTGIWLEGSTGLLFQNFWITSESVGECQPLSSDECVVLFDGRLDNRQELLGVLHKGDVFEDSSDAAYVAAAYQRFGEQLPEMLLGDFALAVFDPSRQKLLLTRDAMGIRPLYFARVANSFLIASECKAILAHPQSKRAPNPDMIAAHFLACFGHEREGWTFFDGISCVVPGQLIVVTPQSTTKRIYWEFPEPETLRLNGFDEYAEAFRHHFEKAVVRRLRSAFPVAVSVSGGLDSSSILCTAETLRRAGVIPCPSILGMTLEIDGPLSDESVYLRAIEDEYGIEIHRTPIAMSGFIAGSAMEGLWTMEAPYLRSRMNFRHPLAQAAGGRGARTFLSGMFGDQMVSNRDYLIDMFRKGDWRLIREHLHTMSLWGVSDIGWLTRDFLHELAGAYLGPSLRRAVRNLRSRARRDRYWFTKDLWRLARRAERTQQFSFPGKTAYQRSLFSLCRPLYYRNSLEWTNKFDSLHKIERSYPFFDRDFILFLMTVPGEVAYRNGIPKALLRGAMKNVLPAAISQRRSKAEDTPVFNSSFREAFQAFRSLFENDVKAVTLGYLDGESLSRAINKLSGSLRDDDSISTWLLADIVALELWLLRFFPGHQYQREEITQNAA